MPHTRPTVQSPMMLTLAQEGGLLSEDAQSIPSTSEGTGGAAPKSTSPFGPNIMLIGVFALFAMIIFTQITSGRKEKKQRAEMMSSLGKHDKVQTVGGIIGSVVEVKGDELMLRVDEASNTRIRVARSAVQKVLHSARSHASETPETADA